MKKYVLKIFIILALLIFASPLSSAQKMKIAILNIQTRDVSPGIGNAVSDLIRSEMVKTGQFTVVERNLMNEILKEMGLQMSGCSDQECIIKIGQIVSAEKILTGEINMVGGAFLITIRIIDIKKGVSEFSANEKASSEDRLDDACVSITRKLTGNIIEGNPGSFSYITREGYYARGALPGWGQYYAGDKIKGGIFFGSFLVAGALTVMAYFDYRDARKAYNDVPRWAPQSEFNDKFDSYENQTYLLLAYGCATALVYILNWVDILFLSSPGFDTVNNMDLFFYDDKVNICARINF